MGQSVIQKNHIAYDMCNFKHPELIAYLSSKTVIDYNQYRYQCRVVGQGCAAKIFLCQKLNQVFKINKGGVHLEPMIKEIYFLHKANAVWPGMFEALVVENDFIVGFSMRYFEGTKIWQAYCDPDNIYYRNPSSRVRLVKKVKEQVKKLQQIQIGHGDLHIDNIMIRQPDKQKEDCEILIVDYGLAFMMDDYKIQKPYLTGWAFMKPSEAKTGRYYDATGLNAYMLGRVALQILLLQKYNNYSHFRDQSPQEQLKCLQRFGFDLSVRKQIELYLDKDIKSRNKMLLQQSQMKEEISQNFVQSNNNFSQPPKVNTGWSLLNYVQNPHTWDENYYVRNPEKLGYQD